MKNTKLRQPAPSLSFSSLSHILGTSWVIGILFVVFALTTYISSTSSETTFVTILLLSIFFTIISLKKPYQSGVYFAGIFLFQALEENLRNPLSVLCAVLVAGAISYSVPRLHALSFILVLWYLGSLDFSYNSWIPALNTGSIILGVLFAGAFITGELWRKRDDRHRRERELAQELIRIQQQATITALHDSVAGILTSAIFRAETMKFSSDLPQQHKSQADLISEDLRQAITKVRALIVTITEETPFSLEEEGLTLEEHLNNFQHRLENYGFRVQQNIDGNNPYLRYTLKGTSQLILPELTSNILKYGKPGSTIVLNFQVKPHSLEVVIRNEVAQVQSDASMSTGLGLDEIQKEVKRLGGRCHFELTDGVWQTLIVFKL